MKMRKREDLFGNKPQINKFDYKYSLKLAKAIQKRRMTCRRIMLKSNWLPHFEKLRTTDGLQQARIKKVLMWLVSHLGEEYIPEVHSARAFREKFFQIESAMMRKEREHEETEDDFKVITKQKGNIITDEIFYED
jgi:hypothetical protein